jgi:hypothetical protein
MNWRRGFVRTWMIAAAAWVVGIACKAAWEWWSLRAACEADFLAHNHGNPNSIPDSIPVWCVVPETTPLTIYAALAIGVPLTILVVGLAVSWAVAGFRAPT